jgi:hypothetical protein
VKNFRQAQATINLLIILVITIAFSSCSSNKLKKPASDSWALKILKAANINDNLEDTEVSDELYAKIITANNLDFASSPTIYPKIPENPGCTLVTDPTTACWVISSRLPSSRSRFFAWAPTNTKDRRPEKLAISMLSDALHKAAHNFYAAAEVSTDVDNPGKFKLITQSNNGVKETLEIDFNLNRKSTARKPPELLKQRQYSSFIETSRRPNDNEGIKLTYHSQDPTTFFVELSKHLPAWAFIYLAPNMKPGAKVPLVLNQGKIHYLIKKAQ